MFFKIILLRFNRLIHLIHIFALRNVWGVDIKYSSRPIIGCELTPDTGSISIGSRTKIDKGVIIRCYGGMVSIGDDCFINPYAVLYGHGGLSIGNGVLIAAHVVVIPANHKFNDVDKYIYQQDEEMMGVVIEDDVWLGTGVRILDGVKISKGSVVGAGAVVTKSTEPYSVNVGVPAKKIGTRMHSV